MEFLRQPHQHSSHTYSALCGGTANTGNRNIAVLLRYFILLFSRQQLSLALSGIADYGINFCSLFHIFVRIGFYIAVLMIAHKC